MAKQRKARESKTNRARTRRIITAIVIRAVLLAAVVFAGVAVFGRAREYLLSLEYFMMDKSSLVIDNRPWWMTEDAQGTILHMPDLPARFSLLEEGLAEKIMTSYEANPWVRAVHYVRKEYPDRIRVGLDLRVPVAFVRTDRLYYLADSEGVRLPGEYGSDKGHLKMLPVIVNYFDGLDSVPMPGKSWLKKDVRAGIAVARELYREGLLKRIGVRAIDVTNYKGRDDSTKSELCLYVDHGIRVDWGRSPDDETPGELSCRYKTAALLTGLDRIKAAGTSLDQVESIDVRFETPAYVLREASELVGGYE